jgi:hypothetical protein
MRAAYLVAGIVLTLAAGVVAYLFLAYFYPHQITKDEMVTIVRDQTQTITTQIPPLVKSEVDADIAKLNLAGTYATPQDVANATNGLRAALTKMQGDIVALQNKPDPAPAPAPAPIDLAQDPYKSQIQSIITPMLATKANSSDVSAAQTAADGAKQLAQKAADDAAAASKSATQAAADAASAKAGVGTLEQSINALRAAPPKGATTGVAPAKPPVVVAPAPDFAPPVIFQPAGVLPGTTVSTEECMHTTLVALAALCVNAGFAVPSYALTPLQQVQAACTPAQLHQAGYSDGIYWTANDAQVVITWCQSNPGPVGVTPVVATGGTSDLNAVRNFLKTYHGPYWTPTAADGPIKNVYVDKIPPATAVPCKPPGYDHLVLCNKR